MNCILRIDTQAGRFVLRQRVRHEPRPGADPLREVACHRAAADAGVAPAMLDAAPDGNWIFDGVTSMAGHGRRRGCKPARVCAA